MKIINHHNVNSVQNPHGIIAKKLYESELVQTVHITLQPKERLIKHRSAVDVLFYILEGSGTVEIGEEIKNVSTDDLIESPANIPHGWINNSNSILRFLVIKTPPPTVSQNKAAIIDIMKNK